MFVLFWLGLVACKPSPYHTRQGKVKFVLCKSRYLNCSIWRYVLLHFVSKYILFHSYGKKYSENVHHNLLFL